MLPIRKLLNKDDAYREKWKKYSLRLQEMIQESDSVRYFEVHGNYNDGDPYHFYISYQKKEIAHVEYLLKVLNENLMDSYMEIGNTCMYASDVDTLIKFASHARGCSITANELSIFLKCNRCTDEMLISDGHIFFNGKNPFNCPHHQGD